MTDHDGLTKRLLTVFLREFLELFWPEVLAYTDLSGVTFLDKEFPSESPKSKKRAADLVAQVKFRGKPAFFLLHIEAQGQQQDHFGQRMFRYFAKLHDKYKLPVYPIALLTFDSPRQEQPETYQVAFPDMEVLRFNYRVVQLNNLSWRDFINHPNPLAAALMAKMRIDKKDRPRVKAECLRMFLTMRLDEEKAGLILEFMETYLALNAKEEKTFERELATIAPELEEEAMEFMTSWEKRGRLLGHRQGRQEEARNLTLRLLQRRFPALPQAVQEKVGTLQLEELEQLVEDSVELATLSDVVAWFDHLKQRT